MQRRGRYHASVAAVCGYSCSKDSLQRSILRSSNSEPPMSLEGQTRSFDDVRDTSAFPPIVLQKSKVAELRIFTKNPKREAIADSYNLNRATEVAYEFNVRR
jgi:hypothetical protein